MFCQFTPSLLITVLIAGSLWGSISQPCVATAAQRGDESDAKRAEPLDSDGSPETPPADRRPKPRHRAEEDLPTRDLVLRGSPDPEDMTPGERIVAALDQKFDVDFQKKPLRECLAQLAESADINLWIDERRSEPGSSESARFDQKITLKRSQARLVTLLAIVLEPRDLAWHVRHDVLCIEPAAEVLARMEVRTYDVAPQLAAGHDAAGLIAAISAVVGAQSDRSERLLGPATALCGAVMFVRHHQPGQMEVAQILAELEEISSLEDEHRKQRTAPQAGRSAVRTGIAGRSRGQRRRESGNAITNTRFRQVPGGEFRLTRVSDDAETDADESERILRALDERFDADYAGKTVREVLLSLGERAKIPVHLDDRIAQVGTAASSLDRKITMQLEQVRLESLLELLLESAPGDPGTPIWTIRHDALWISPPLADWQALEARTYDVANLLESGHDSVELIEAIRTTVEPLSWTQPGTGFQPGGAVECDGQVLFIRQTQARHLEIAQVLAELDAIVEAAVEAGEQRPELLTWKTYRVSPESAEGLAKNLPDIVAPDSWSGKARPGKPKPQGEIRSGPGFLLIRQTRSVHSELRKLIASF